MGEDKAIKEVIAFVEEIIDELPKTAKEAKSDVKLELMREQLKIDTEVFINDVFRCRKDLTDLYISTYKNDLGESDFNYNYQIIRLNLNNALSSLESVYSLLNVAEEEELFLRAGEVIGKTKVVLESYNGNYDVAKRIGKRESIKDLYYSVQLSYTEYRLKMLALMEEIKNDPENPEVGFKIKQGRELYKQFNATYSELDPKEYKGANIFKDALDLNKKAMKIFEKKNKVDAILSDIFSRIEKEKIKEKELSYLKEGIEISLWKLRDLVCLKMFMSF